MSRHPSRKGGFVGSFPFLGTIRKFDWTVRLRRISLASGTESFLDDNPRARQFEGRKGMKLAGFLLLVAGWAIVVSALALLPSAGPRTAFALAGMAVELLGLALAVRSHLVLEAEGE